MLNELGHDGGAGPAERDAVAHDCPSGLAPAARQPSRRDLCCSCHADSSSSPPEGAGCAACAGCAGSWGGAGGSWAYSSARGQPRPAEHARLDFLKVAGADERGDVGWDSHTGSSKGRTSGTAVGLARAARAARVRNGSAQGVRRDDGAGAARTRQSRAGLFQEPPAGAGLRGQLLLGLRRSVMLWHRRHRTPGSRRPRPARRWGGTARPAPGPTATSAGRRRSRAGWSRQGCRLRRSRRARHL